MRFVKRGKRGNVLSFLDCRWCNETLDQKWKNFNGILVDPWTQKSRLSRLELVTQKFEKIVENARNLKAWSDRSGLVNPCDLQWSTFRMRLPWSVVWCPIPADWAREEVGWEPTPRYKLGENSIETALYILHPFRKLKTCYDVTSMRVLRPKSGFEGGRSPEYPKWDTSSHSTMVQTMCKSCDLFGSWIFGSIEAQIFIDLRHNTFCHAAKMAAKMP